MERIQEDRLLRMKAENRETAKRQSQSQETTNHKPQRECNNYQAFHGSNQDCS